MEENAVVEMNPVVEEIKELDEEPEQKLRQGLTEIDLAANDFEDPGEIWTKPPDLEQTLREGLTDISLDQTEFKPEYPKNLSSFEASSKTTSQDLEISKDSSEIRNELDDYELKQSIDENAVEAENQFDKMLLSDSGKDSDELDMGVIVRFIEFMPLDADENWSTSSVVTLKEIFSTINSVYPLEEIATSMVHMEYEKES